MTTGRAGAGVSADHEALRSRLKVAEYERLLAEERARLGRFRLTGRTERRVAALLAPTEVWGWHLLPDRRWPGTRTANIDMIHVGPGGVLVIDVKTWKAPRVEDERLFNGTEPADDDVAKLLRVVEMVEAATAAVGLAPLQVIPVIVFAGRRNPELQLGRLELVGERGLVPWLTRRPARLSEEQVLTLTEGLAEHFPAYDVAPPTTVTVLEPNPVVPRAAQPDPDELVLFDADEIESSIMAAAMAQPIESWMTWLHPEQTKLVRQSRSGPARIRGPAGTGKTVVGLHRAAYLAATRPGRILYTSYVRTLPAVLGALYGRLAPVTRERVEFTSIHRWAGRLLRDRGLDVTCDQNRAGLLFNTAWAKAGRHSVLESLDLHPNYWRDEIDYVVKGRGLTDFAEYVSLRRVGRRSPLQPDQRAAVWDLYRAYDGLLREAGVSDVNDVLRRALSIVRQEPVDPPYAAVIVDEVQDLNLLGVQLLHALVGDRPDGLLLIGDGQQAVYPGGFSLSEAGINVTGRSTVLRVNYRNTAEILDVASQVVTTDPYDDLDGVPEPGSRDVQVSRTGGVTIRVDQPDGQLHDLSLVTAVRQHHTELGVRLGDMAVLCTTNWKAAHYLRVLPAAGIDCAALENYDGTTTQQVKVGTFHRAKGLEFVNVYLPGLSSRPIERLSDEPESTYKERVELAHRQLFVGMTRARDLLWLGYRD